MPLRSTRGPKKGTALRAILVMILATKSPSRTHESAAEESVYVVGIDAGLFGSVQVPPYMAIST
jgi:hypothetical protein